MPIDFTHLDNQKVESTESFFSNSLLNARIHSDQESNADYDPIFEENRSPEWCDSHWQEIQDNALQYEEDINQYLTLTLADLANPKTLDMLNEYLVDINADVGQIAGQVPHRSQKYHLYRINADFLLLNLGLFDGGVRYPGDAYFDKGGSYYQFAAASLKAIQGGRTGLSDVFDKLSVHFGRYVDILRQMRRDSDNYLSFHYRIPQSELEQFEKDLTLEMEREKRRRLE